MTQADVRVDWTRARFALAAEVQRVCRLLRSGLDPDAPALGDWTIAGVAMHLSQAWLAVPGLAKDDLSEVYAVVPTIEGTAGRSLIRELSDLARVTKLGVSSDPERDLSILADRIQARAGAYLDAIDGSEPGLRPWLVQGTEVPGATLTCHLLNETIVHGWDIARAAGRAWPIEPSHAALVVEGFILPVFQVLRPGDMVDQEHAAGVRAVYELRVRGGGRYRFAFDDGSMMVEGPLDGRPRGIDCHLSADPAEMLLVAWGRRSQWPAIASGKLTAWGRKPWLGPRFRSLLRTP